MVNDPYVAGGDFSVCDYMQEPCHLVQVVKDKSRRFSNGGLNFTGYGHFGLRGGGFQCSAQKTEFYTRAIRKETPYSNCDSRFDEDVLGLIETVNSQQSRDKLQKKAQQQKNESAKEKPRHPCPALAFGHKRDAQRNKPHQQSKFEDHLARIIQPTVTQICKSRQAESREANMVTEMCYSTRCVQVLPPSVLDHV